VGAWTQLLVNVSKVFVKDCAAEFDPSSSLAVLSLLEVSFTNLKSACIGTRVGEVFSYNEVAVKARSGGALGPRTRSLTSVGSSSKPCDWCRRESSSSDSNGLTHSRGGSYPEE